MNNLLKLILIIGSICYIISKRNEFERLRRAIEHESSNIGIFISKRKACLDDALKIAKISYQRETEGIERLTANDQLNHLLYLGQKYPDLQYTHGYNEILRQAFKLDEDIAATRALVNGNICEYNNAITAFPGLIIAKIFRYKQEKFIDEENIADNRRLDKGEVDFSNY